MHDAHVAPVRARVGRLLVAVVALVALAAPVLATADVAAAQAGQRASDVVYDGTTDRLDGAIYRLYRAFLLREPDGDGIVYWISQARYGGLSIGSIAEEFARSPEFVQRYGALDDGAFVDLVYRNVLDRDADPGGRSYWLGQLSAGMLRGHLMVHFSESPEYGHKVGAGPFGAEDHRGPAQPAPDAPPGSYRFWSVHPSTGSPVTWPRCRPVYVVANPAGIPVGEHDEFLLMLQHALDTLSDATDQDWVYVGRTTHRAADENTTRDLHGAVTVSFMTAPDPNDKASAWAAPEAGFDPLTGAVHYTTGFVNLNAQRLVGDEGGEVTSLVATVLMHELGHVAGLDHVDDPGQLMHGYYSAPTEPRYETYRQGDLAGLARVGSTTVAC